MRKIFLILLVISLSLSGLHAQFLHFGLKTLMTTGHEMSYYSYDITDYVYYFANENNETIRFSGFETSQIKSRTPHPDIYVRYNHKNNLYFQADMFLLWFTNEAIYKNSVDFSEYSETFNPTSSNENLGYNSIQLKWSFWGNSLTAGYIFFKTKAIRPYIFTGITVLHLVNLKQGDYYDESRYYRNEIIFNNLSTYKKRTLYSTNGIGLKYHGISLSIQFIRSMGAIDIYADNYYNEEENLSLTERPNYETFRAFNFGLSINLFSFNFIENKNKKNEI